MGRGDITVRFFGDTRDLDGKLTGLRGSLDRMGHHMMDFGKKMTTFVSLPIVAGAVLAVKAAADEAQEIAVLDQAVRRNMNITKEQRGEVEKQITAWQNATGILDGQLRPALGNLMRTGADWNTIQKEMAIAMDIAVAKGIPVENVTKAMGKAALGNVGALGKLGVATKGVWGETLTFDQVLQNAAKTMGGSAARAAHTNAGKMQIMKARFQDMVEEIGVKLMPVLDRLLGWLTEAVDWWEKQSPAVQNMTLAAVGLLAIIGPLTTAIGGLVIVLGFLTGPIGLVVLAIGAIIAAAVLLWIHWDQVWGWIKNHPAIAAVVAILFTPIAAFVALIGGLKWLWENWRNIWEWIKQAATDAKNWIVTAFNNVVDFFQNLPGRIIGALLALPGLLWGLFTGALNAAKNVALAGIDRIVQFFADLPGRILGFAFAMLGAGVELGKAVINGIKGGLSAVAGFAADVAGAILQAFKDGWNAVANRINDFIPNDVGFDTPFGFVGVDLPDNPIPRFHSGGIVPGRPDQEILALLRGGERVVADGSGGASIVVNVRTDADPFEIGRELSWALKTSGR